MSKKQRLETNVPTAHEDLAYAKHRGMAVRKGAVAEIKNGLLIHNSIRNGKRKTRVLDLPHRIAFVSTAGWPVEADYMVGKSIVAASTREGFTSGVGLKQLTEEDLEGDGTQRISSVIWAAGGTPPMQTYLTSTAGTNHYHDSIVVGEITSDNGGHEGTVGRIVMMPMSPARPLAVSVTVVGHTRMGTRLLIPESLIRTLTGGMELMPRGLKATSAFERVYLPIHIPEPAPSYSDTDMSVFVPLTRSGGTERDYGERAVLLVRADVVEPGGSSYYLVPLPQLPQFSNPPWLEQGADREGFAPSYMAGSAVRLGGVDYYYGSYLGYLYPDDAEADRYREIVSTLFRLQVDPAGVYQWDVIRCGVSSTRIAHALVNATADPEDRLCFWPSAAWAAAGDTWAVFLGFGGNSGDLRSGSSGLTVDNVIHSLFVCRGDAITATGLPPGVRLFNPSSGSVRIYPRTYDRISWAQNIFVCHLNTPEHFGFTFIGIDEATNRRVLAKWDTLSGWGRWDIDLSALPNDDAGPSIGTISCYRPITLDEEYNEVGDPGFIIGLDDGGPVATYVVTAGKATFVAPVVAGAATPVGNALTKDRNTRDIYQKYTKPKEE